MDSKNPFISRTSLFQKKEPSSFTDSLPTPQIGSISDATLGNLRETIKNAMIPLLIKVFELKLAASQAKTPPSRLQKAPKESFEDIQNQLGFLLKDLDLLHMWCESSQKQVSKAMKEILLLNQESEPPRNQKSFNNISEENDLPGKEKAGRSWLRKFFSW